MDNKNWNSLGMDESKNADAFDASAQPPTHPANSITSPDSTVNNQIISSANLAPPTPLNAPLPTDPLHPTHTVGSGKGDVLVRGGRTRRNKPLIIAIIIGAIVLFIFTLCLPLLLRSDEESVLALFQRNLEPTERIESFFQAVYFREKTTSDIMTSETHDMLDQNIKQFTAFQEKLSKVNIDKVDASVRDDVKKVQEQLAQQAGKFDQSVELYNTLYAVYETGNPEALEGYLASENYTIATIAERFQEFLQEKQSLQGKAETNGCNLEGENTTDICTEIVAEYHETLESMEQSFAVPQAIFFAYDETEEINYDEENTITNSMRRVIEELEKP